MVDREKMIQILLEAEDGPGLRMAYGFLEGVSEDTEEGRRSGSYQEPELNMKMQAVKCLLSIGDDMKFGLVKNTLGTMRQINDVNILRKIYTVANTHLNIIKEREDVG